jgi:Ca2+-binding RTX toxin-like protein
MRGYDTIIGGSEKDLIIDYPGADSLMGGAGSDFIFTPDYDLQQYDGTDTVNGDKENDCCGLMTQTTPPVALEAMLL